MRRAAKAPLAVTKADTMASQPVDMCIVRRACAADCTVAAALHARELHGEFLSSLGTHFLTVLYRGINAHPDGFVLVAERNGMVIGFVSGATNNTIVSSEVIRLNWIVLAFWSGFHILANLKLLPAALAALKHGEGQYAGQAELLAIAIAATAQNNGAGKALLTAFQREMRSRNVQFFHLIVAERNTKARSFYERNGFELLERISLFGTWKCRLGSHVR